MSLKSWRNGEKAGVIQKIIENNFKLLGRYLSNHMLSLPRDKRLSLADEYLSNNLIVYDTTEEIWYKYKNGEWVKYNIIPVSFSKSFDKTIWKNGKIQIPYTTHLVENPTVQVFILNDNGDYEDVLGGIYIDSENNVVLSSDMAFAGKVVIK